jgi:SAM-dependent methyltransferase
VEDDLRVKTDYLDLEATIGVTKHLGGIPASRRLLEACHVAEAREVLDVGCGVGVEPIRIARTTRARVVGLDLSERMLAWADLRAREAGVRDRIELVRGDVLDLPFATDRFDAVLCESVLAFVADKEQAIGELVRVTRPGGWLGLNEACHLGAAPPPRVTSLVTSFAPEDLLSVDEWRALWAATGLRDRTVRIYRLDAARELRGRLRWYGPGWVLRGLGRAVRAYATRPEMRAVVHSMVRATIERADDAEAAEQRAVWVAMGFGLFAGRK